ncbi:DsbA family protein [Oerskovia flava]|uniref:DsbA family protein n=1 Tax=Oerskovia flava TaxID=2986422 RepID=UPI00223EB6B6|nr:thioredoxin domain-containing protein [Oerskovia sp. JB1-3-2]
MPTEKPQSKAERREAARAEALALREAQAKRDKRSRTITISALAVGVLVLVGLGAYILSQAGDPDRPLEGVAAPTVATENGGIPVGAEGAAGTDNGPDAVEVGVYLDYMCPRCGEFEAINGPTLDELREAGDITLVLHPVSILDRQSNQTQFSTRSAATAGFVADRAPEAMNEFNTLMFASQPGEGSSGFTDEQMADIAVQAGVPQDVADEIADGAPMDEFGKWAEGATQVAMSEVSGPNGFGTPTVTIDGERWEGNWGDPTALATAITEAQG